MKKRITTLTLIFTALFSTLSLFGQESENSDPKFGLGANFFNLAEYSNDFDYVPANSIYMTINIGKKFRLEPMFGFAFYDKTKQYSIGIGGFGRKSISKFNLLYGLRLGYISSGSIIMSPTVGGEYYFIKNFSIGTEVQLRTIFDDNEFLFLSNTAVIFRFYFN